jgi:hypothetical protein
MGDISIGIGIGGTTIGVTVGTGSGSWKWQWNVEVVAPEARLEPLTLPPGQPSLQALLR